MEAFKGYQGTVRFLKKEWKEGRQDAKRGQEKREGQKILLVEDDWELGEGITWMLEKEGFMPLAASFCPGRQKNGIRKRVRTWCYWT